MTKKKEDTIFLFLTFLPTEFQKNNEIANNIKKFNERNKEQKG